VNSNLSDFSYYFCVQKHMIIIFNELSILFTSKFQFDENGETLRPSLKADIQRHLLGVIHRRNNNIGNSALFVESPPGTVSNFKGAL
jgi:hypothetical protein